MLEVLGFKAIYVMQDGRNGVYDFKCCDVYQKTLYYSGYLLDGVKEGKGRLENFDGSLFYEGLFRGDQIYGNIIKLWHNSSNLLAILSNDNQSLEVDDSIDEHHHSVIDLSPYLLTKKPMY